MSLECAYYDIYALPKVAVIIVICVICVICVGSYCALYRSEEWLRGILNGLTRIEVLVHSTPEK